jgi:hypothetical protein
MTLTTSATGNSRNNTCVKLSFLVLSLCRLIRLKQQQVWRHLKRIILFINAVKTDVFRAELTPGGSTRQFTFAPGELLKRIGSLSK